jgi:MarR family transcriptional regulator, organic hydroperoxide resistance regulator
MEECGMSRRNAQNAEGLALATRKAVKLPAALQSSGGRRQLGTSRADEVSRQIIWDVVSINTYLEDMRRGWAKLFGVSGPQWLILMAIDDLDKGNGVPVGEVSAKIHAASTFVTTQTKLLEKQGFLKRVSCTTDARVVLMSLSDQARKEIGKMSERWNALQDFLFSDFDAATLRDVRAKLELLKKRAESACRRVADEI